MAKIDGRRFTKIRDTWYSNRSYKTYYGARKYMHTLAWDAVMRGAKAPNYEVVESHEFRYTRVDGLPIVYRVAVKP